MKTLPLLLLGLCFVLTQTNAQDVLTKFKTEICGCLQKMKPETIATSAAVEKELSLCFGTSIVAHQKELKKRKIIDFENATSEETKNIMQQVFKDCMDAAVAAYGRMEFLENEEAAQSFQGMIMYVQDIELSGAFKKMGLTKAVMIDEMNKKGSWFDTLRVSYQLGNYASIGNNDKVTSKVYDASENIIYNFEAKGSDMCSVQDAVDLDFSGNPDKPTVTELDSAITIMGMPCKIIRMKWKLSQFDYYYNATQAQVNPDLFSKHSSEGFAEFVKMTKCLPLQVVRGSMGMLIIQTATEVKPGKVHTDVFTIPELVEDESLNIMKLPGIKIMRIKK